MSDHFQRDRDILQEQSDHTDATNDLIARSDAFDEKIADTDVHQTVIGLVHYAKKNRRTVRLLVISVILDIVLSIALAIAGYHVNEVSRDADRASEIASRVAQEVKANSQSLRAACEAGNEFRKNLVASQNQETEDLIAASQEENDDPNENAEAIERYRRRRAASLAPLARPRDCGTPTTVP